MGGAGSVEDVGAIVAFFKEPLLFGRAELVETRLGAVPAVPGLYGWYFDELPHPEIAPIGTAIGDWKLLYVGIAPGRPGSRSNLRQRLGKHLRGDARRSTLRLTLGSLLSEKLALTPVPRSGGVHFGIGERLLDAWMDEHARVAWLEHPEPWLVEAEVVRQLTVPLNRAHNAVHPFSAIVGAARRAVRAGHGG